MEMIDINCHWMPERYYKKIIKISQASQLMFERAKRIPVMADLEKRLEMMDRFPGYLQIPSLVSPPLESLAGPDKTPDIARLANDSMAEWCTLHPQKFPGFVACLPLNNPGSTLIEAERVTKELPAVGVQIFTNLLGKPIDTQDIFALFELMVNINKPIWLHPIRSMQHPDYTTEMESRYEIWWSLGWPYETSTAMARLVFSGIFDKFPQLKIVTHHAGGFIPMMEGRLSDGMQEMGSRTPENKKHLAENNLKNPPIEYFKKFYADTASFGSDIAIEAGLKFFGEDKLMFATDSPFDFQGGARHIEQTIASIQSIHLTDQVKQKIFSRNIKKLII